MHWDRINHPLHFKAFNTNAALKIADITTKSKNSFSTPITEAVCICTLLPVDIIILPCNLKALPNLFTDASSTIIRFMLCAKLDANSIVALVSFWA